MTLITYVRVIKIDKVIAPNMKFYFVIFSVESVGIINFPLG